VKDLIEKDGTVLMKVACDRNAMHISGRAVNIIEDRTGVMKVRVVGLYDMGGLKALCTS
jgi:hypothetical protein